jgi:hypothetical protein
LTSEDLLTRTFAEVTERTEYPSTQMATVVARSHAVRADRRRRVAYVAAAAVVAVGGVSAAVALGGGGDGPPAPAGRLDALPTGAPPKIDYLDGSTFIMTSGQRLTSPLLAKAEDAVAWRTGVLVAGRATSRHPFSRISFLSRGAPASSLGCGGSSLAVPAGRGDPIYWLSSACTVESAGRFVSGSRSVATTKGATFSPVGDVPGGVVVFASTSVRRLPSHALVVPQNGGRMIPLHLLIPSGVSASANLVCGEALDGRDGVVVDASTGDVRWRAHDWTLSGFSASGRYVVGSQRVGDQTVGGGGDVVGIFDAATGHQVLRQELPRLTIDTLPVWEDDSSALVTAEDSQGREAMLRVSLDGSVTRTTRVVQGTLRPDAGRPPVPVFRPAATP